MVRVSSWVALLLLWTAGCHAHVALQAPSPNAAPEKRAEAYEELRPLSYHETHITYLRGGMPVGGRRVTDFLQLANGKRVYYPEDLLTVLPEQSPSATAARQSADARVLGNNLQIAGIVAAVVGTAAMLIPLATGDYSITENRLPFYGGTAGLGVGTVLVLLAMAAGYNPASDAAATAFETYDAGLRERLGVCVAEGRPIICGEQPPDRSTGPSSPPSSQPSGCQKDTDCKGSRVCDRGQCVDPVAAVAPPHVSIEPPPAPAMSPQGCNLCAEKCAPHKSQCNAGVVSACFKLGGCICECQRDFGGCGRTPAELEACIAKAAAAVAP